MFHHNSCDAHLHFVQFCHPDRQTEAKDFHYCQSIHIHRPHPLET